MKLVRFSQNGTTRIGTIVGDSVVDLTAIYPEAGHSMRAFLTRLPGLRAAIEACDAPRYDVSDVTLEAPIADPQKFLAIGMNYQAHADEALKGAGIPLPTSQLWFNKQVSCINGPYSEVEIPSVSTQVDYEAELGVIIGKRCRNVSRADARSVIAGYVVCNDVTAREWQFRSPTYTLGKSFDTHGPIGPWITTDDEIADPHALMLTLEYNGEERQRSSTGDMIYGIFDQIEYLSTVMTLEPGDILATGTPAGVGIASATFMQPGDVVRVSVEGLGFIENTFVAGR
ncbi:fumarylacetoacetate hydrolase family protein [Novosphingobium sp. Leaf2]|uniref:fumarylacetoacetate hydrolase family protein n=1 Tax=Novosphingobium sp. Leaf2 TaxID=1735670 RepID=UPI0006F2DBF0|nr:fumarylacetoacetate hydrolase family protein [Novosphingobium sp. Leaf2]KQM20795.1 5-carboxymethyl-2-hydroxymuconate isomerase [Novosphingobium sp. Leaf2]